MNNFLAKFKTTDSIKHANFVSMRGGKYAIPKSEKDHFYSLYSKYMKSNTHSNSRSLVFKWPLKKCGPLCLDIDIQTAELHNQKECYESYIDIGKCMAIKLYAESNREVKFAVVAKPSGYFTNVHGKRVYKIGCHIYFPGTRFLLDDSIRFRDYLISQVESLLKDIPYINSVQDIVDQRIPKMAWGRPCLHCC